MKKLFCAILAAVIGLSGCSANQSETKEEVKETKPNATFKYAKLLPDLEKEYPDATIDIYDQDGGKAYIFKINGLSKDDFYDYVYKCKELGFIEVAYETENSFGSYYEGGAYWVEAGYYNDGSIKIICQTSKNYKGDEENE